MPRTSRFNETLGVDLFEIESSGWFQNRFLQHGVLGHVVSVVHSYPGQDFSDGREVKNGM